MALFPKTHRIYSKKMIQEKLSPNKLFGIAFTPSQLVIILVQSFLFKLTNPLGIFFFFFFIQINFGERLISSSKSFLCEVLVLPFIYSFVFFYTYFSALIPSCVVQICCSVDQKAYQVVQIRFGWCLLVVFHPLPSPPQAKAYFP